MAVSIYEVIGIKEVVDKKLKLSVCVITYNHEQYIRQCLQSIVDQKTDFAFEVIVGEDCSTDGTRRIVHEFAKAYPAIFKTLYHEQNVGGTTNLLAVYSAACGEYIAHVDGDDYMLPGKLRAQVEILDKNPDCSMCFHVMKQFDQRNQRYMKLRSNTIPRKSDISFLLMHISSFFHSSKMFRTKCNDHLEPGKDELIDSYFHVHHALRGNILYLSDPLGVYRLNVGVASVKNTSDSIYRIPAPWMLEKCIDAIEYAGRNGTNADLIIKAKAMLFFRSSYSHLMANDFEMFRKLIKISCGIYKLNKIQLLFMFLSDVPIVLFLLVHIRARLRKMI